ncbi:MAG: hypothetical protein J6K44_07625 [Clostridia bacterium]|nr:hypothetical protein [Clostridia bacterium]MBP3583896.1 hypothetical protein [Clostridia bacterium]
MSKRKAVRGRSAMRILLLNFLWSAGILLVFSLICTFILGMLDNPTESLGLYSLVTLLVSALVAGFVCRRSSGTLGAALLSLLLTVIVMMLIGVIISGGKLTLSAVMNYLCYFGAGLVGAAIKRK